MQTPPVITWFRVYCGVLCAIYLLCAAAGAVILLVDPADLDMTPTLARLMGAMLFVVGAVFAVACAAPFFLEREPWVWTYDLVIICLGLTSACFLPVCVPLLIFWIKPEVKAYFRSDLSANGEA